MQKGILSKILFVAITIISIQASSGQLSSAEKISDLNQLVAIIKSGYGPLQYKDQVLGINIDRLARKYQARIPLTQSNVDFYYLLVQFVAEFKDSHFSASLPTTQVATLPITTDLVDGKVLVDQVNRMVLNHTEFPFERGDEIIAVNGLPVSRLLDVLQTYSSAGYAATARRRAAMMIPYRPGSNVPVPTGEIRLSLLKENEFIPTEVLLKWNVTGEAVDETALNINRFLKVSPSRRDFNNISSQDMWTEFKDFHAERSFRCSGNTRAAIPSNATIIMKSPFVAYYYPTLKGNVGYLRIPHYSPMGPMGEPEFGLRFAQYEFAISALEKNTIGLVIDQDHNCGGRVSFLHQLVSLFMSTTFKPMQFQLLANKQEYLSFKSWTQEINQNTLEYQGVLNTFELIKTSWLSGSFMTPLTSLDGSTQNAPNHIRYTKPIVVLIDEMSGSGGDAFPAMLQGFWRAVLLGTRTMGAGGHVMVQSPLNFSQVNLRMTKSLFFRPDGVAVENNGAVPNIPYTITRSDFVNEYKGYQEFYTGKLLDLIR